MTHADQNTPAASSAPRRLSLSNVVELLLQKSPRDHSSVTLSRNAKGGTQIEVVVRTGDDPEHATPDYALAKAMELYNIARAAYPLDETPTAGAAKGSDA